MSDLHSRQNSRPTIDWIRQSWRNWRGANTPFRIWYAVGNMKLSEWRAIWACLCLNFVKSRSMVRKLPISCSVECRP